jgi:hypothetical protein
MVLQRKGMEIAILLIAAGKCLKAIGQPLGTAIEV